MSEQARTYKTVRAGLLLQGYSLSAWAREQGVSTAWVRRCLAGRSKGAAAAAMVKKVLVAAKITEPSGAP
jgi:gp16 family phage-associated protein